VKRIRQFTMLLLMEARSAATGASGSQIAEFAVALPLLLIMVVGIFDFGNAYNIKQRVTNVAREAARMGASQPTADLTTPTPASILEIRDMVAAALQNGRLSDCGLGTTAAVAAGAATPWKWTFTTSCGTAGNLVLTVDRGFVFTSSVTAGGTAVKMISTNVTLLYPYQWKFNRLITLVVPTAIYPGTTQISVASVMANQS
jgi:Flp pilus assembly protein TadG